MRIRNQIAVAIMPLFLGLTVVSGALTYYLQVKELTWGLNEESTSIAVSTARLIDVAAAARLAAGDTSADADAAIRDQFRDIVSWGRARRLTLLAGADLRVLVQVPDGSESGARVEIPPSVIAALDRQPFATGPLLKGAKGATVLTAFAPVRDPAGLLLGVLAVETHAETFASQRETILRSVLISLAAATLLGLLLAVFISTMITRRLSELTRRVLQVETAGAVPESGAGIIDEVNDLVNTFDTMKSVLGEVLAKSKRTLIEAEQFRTDEDLASAYRSEFQPPARRSVAGMDVAGSLFGGHATGSFFGIWDLPDGGCAFVGTSEAQGIMEQTVAAAAALAHLEQSTRNMAIGPALAATAALFSLTLCDGVAWRDGGSDTVRWSLDQGAGEWQRERVDVPAGATVVLHTLGTPADDRIHTYVEQFRHLPPDILLGEVQTIIDEKLGGALLLVRRAIDTPAS